MPRKESKFVNDHFSKPWIQPMLATFDPNKFDFMVKPEHVVAQIINIKEGCQESLGETDHDSYASADLHDSHVRASAVFTKEAIEEFEKYEESLSGCEFEHLPNSILLLKKFRIIPKITDQLCDCNLVICIESFILWTSEGPTCTISCLPRARSSCAVIFNIQRLWTKAQENLQEESGTEALTNSDLPFSCDDLSQLLAEVKKDSSLLQSSQSTSQLTVASQSQGTPSVGPGPDPPDPGPSGPSSDCNSLASQSQHSPSIGPVTSGPDPDPPDPGPSGTSSISNHPPEKSIDSPDGRREQDEAEGSTSEGGEKEDSLKWRHVHQLASWVFEVNLPSSVAPGDTREDRMEEVVRWVTGCVEKLPDRGHSEDEESSCEKDGMQGQRSQDLGAKQASPVPRSPFSRRKSRRGKRKSPLVKKPEVLRGPSLASHGQEREEKLMHEKITKLLPTTMLVTLSKDDIEPLPEDYDLDDDDDYDDIPHSSDLNNNLNLREWDGEYLEEVQPSSSVTKDKQQTPSSVNRRKRVDDPPHSGPAKTSSKKLFAEQLHPPGTEQSLQNVLEDIDELFDNHSEKLLRDAIDAVDTPFKTYHSHKAHSATGSAAELGTAGDGSHDAAAESNSPKEQSQYTEGDSIMIVDQSSQSSQDDDETQIPPSLSPSRQSPAATAPSLSVKKRLSMPSTSSATLSDSSQSDFMINVSGDSDFTILKCSIDDRMKKERTTDGTGDHEEQSDIGSGSDSDIFSPVDTSHPVETSGGTTEVAESSDNVPGLPNTSFSDGCNIVLKAEHVIKRESDNATCGTLTGTTYSTTSDIVSNSKDRCVASGKEKALPRVTELSRKRKQMIVCDDGDKRGSSEKRIRFADPDQSSACLDGSLEMDSASFKDSHIVWTSTQNDGKEAGVQERIFVLSSEEESSQKESAEKQTSSAHSSGMRISGWISKQDMVRTKQTTVPGVEDIQEGESEETEVTNSHNFNARSCRKQNSCEELSPIVRSSGGQGVDVHLVDTQETTVKETVHSLVSAEGSAKDSNKTAEFSVTPVLFSSGESTKAATQQQDQTPSDKTLPVTDYGDIRESEHGKFCGAMQNSHNLDDVELMSIETPEDSLSFNPEKVLFSSGKSTKAATSDGIQQQNQTPSEKTLPVTVGESEHGTFCGATQDSHNLDDEEEPMSIDTPEDSLSFNPENTALPMSSAEVAKDVNSPEDKFTKIICVSLSTPGRFFVKETQPESSSISTPRSSNRHSSKSPRPPEKVVFVEGGDLVQEISEEELDISTSNPPFKFNTETAKNSPDEQKTSHQERKTQGLSSAELPKISKTLIEQPKPRVTQSVLSSKIYMGSMKVRQMTLNRKQKPSATQTRPSSKSKNVLPKKQGADAQNTLNSCLLSGQNSRKSKSDVEKRAAIDTSMDAAITSDDSSSDIGFTSLGKSPTSGRRSSSKNRTADQAEVIKDRPGGSSTASPSRPSRSERATKDKRSSDRKRKKRDRHRIGHLDIEQNLLSPVFSLPSPDEDESLSSSLTESILNGTHLPSDDSASSTGEEALLDWCAMYLLESSKR